MSRRVGSAFVITLAAQLIGNLQGLALLPIVIRSSGAATYGTYILVNLSVAQIIEVMTTGIAYRYTRKLVSAASFAERRELFEPQFNFQLLVFAAISVFLLVIGPPIDRLLEAAGLYIDPRLLIALVAANLLEQQVLMYYRCTLRMIPFNIVIGGRVLVFLSALGGFTLLNGSLSLDQLFTIRILSGVLVNLPFAIGMLREIGLPRLTLPVRAIARDIRAGLALTFDMIVDFILGSGDRYLITLFLSVTDVGRYQPAYQLASVVLFWPRLVVTVLSPMVLRLIDAGNRVEAERIVDTALSLFLMMGVPFVVGSLMMGPSIILVLTNADVAEAGRWVTPFVAAGVLLFGTFWILNTICIGLNRPRLILIADVKGAVANFALNVALLPLFKSITVPAIATFVGYGVSAGALVLALRPLWRLHLEWGAIMRFVAAASAMGAALWLLGFRPGEVAPVGLIRVTAVALAGVVVYFGVLNLLGGFGRRQWQEIRGLIGSQAPDTGSADDIGTLNRS